MDLVLTLFFINTINVNKKRRDHNDSTKQIWLQVHLDTQIAVEWLFRYTSLTLHVGVAQKMGTLFSMQNKSKRGIENENKDSARQG